MKRGSCLRVFIFTLVFLLLFGGVSATGIVNGYHFDEPMELINDENEYLFVYDFADSFHGAKGSWTYNQYPEQVAGKSGYAYNFDGRDDRIGFQNQNTPVFSNPFTLEMWIKLNNPVSPSHAFTLIKSSPVTNAEQGFQLGINIYGCLYIVDPHLGILDSNFCSWNLNQWYHIAFVYDSTYNKLYVNNQPVGQKLYNTALSGNFNLRYMTIGTECTSGTCNNFFDGVMDEIKFYNYTKTSFDINKDIAYKTEKCNSNSDCSSGLNCKEDFYYNKIFKRCCEPNECVYNENCYANGAEVRDYIYKCINGEWRIKNKKTTGNKVLDLNLNEGSGTLASDSSGYGNNGVLIGNPLPTWVNGYNGKAIDVSQQNDASSEFRKHISVSNNPILNFNYALKEDVYFKYHNDNNFCCNGMSILSKGILYENAWTEQLGYHLFLENNKVCFVVVTDIYYGYSGTQKTRPYNNKVCSASTINKEQWYNIKGVYDGEYIGIYVNGVLENKAIARGKIINSDSWLGTYELLVGADTYTSPLRWRLYSNGINGVIDEVKVYDYADNLGTNIYWYANCVDYMCVAKLCPDPENQNSCPTDDCTQDSDCLPPPPPTCDDGNLDLGEQCDDGNTIFCDGCSNCVIDKCGDNLLCGNEQCEGNNLNGKTCAGLGFDSGTLACYSNCSFDYFGCVSAEIVPCTLKKSYWANADLVEYLDMQEVVNNTLVFLMQKLSGDCNNKRVDFKMYKDGSFYKSIGVVKVDNLSNTAFSSWITNNHGNESEFYFTVELDTKFNTSNKIVITNDSEEGPGANCTYYGFKCCAVNLCYQEIPSLTCSGDKKCCYGCSESFEGCGDGFIQDREEECDGSNLGGANCVSIDTDYIGGVLMCYGNCSFNEANCLTEGIDVDDSFGQDQLGDNSNQLDCNGDCDKEGSSSTLLIVIVLVVLLFVVSFLIGVYLFKNKNLKSLQQTTFSRGQPPVGSSPMGRASPRRPGPPPQRMIAQRPNIMKK